MKKTIIAASLVCAAGIVVAQHAGVVRMALQTQDLSISGKVAVQARAEIDPGVSVGRHTHPGEELGYVLDGQLELVIDGQPPKIVKAGESYFVPAGLVHDGKNTGSGKVKVLATYIIEKGKPVATPVK